ncbi:hypothetical protein K7X08_003987 [Anisodus acutangulus]|uniref:CYTH domain-containing protein n=1 Tax=Anisodus acutangulus TaxID=402998 RepID=A0A9Q1MK88_9SOLA|nr:hypothetical protein K7X08_003987 [Anisodus acutangulus]
MEVEVKLRLPDSSAHQKVLSLLSPYHTKTHHQRNAFFDGACGELRTRRAVLRLRFYENLENVKCMVCLKGKATIIDGVSRVEEDEEELDSKIGYECVANPSKLMEVVCLDDSRVLRRAKEEFHVGEEGFIGLGGFKNVRNVFEWNGVELEVDETMTMILIIAIQKCQSLLLSGPESCLSLRQRWYPISKA